MSTIPLAFQILRHPERGLALSDEEWSLLLVQFRNARLLARIAVDAERLGIMSHLPRKVREHLVAARVVAAAAARMARWEIRQVVRALGPTGIEPVLIKGASYIAAGLPIAEGRPMSDIDVLVGKDQLPAAEAALTAAGWQMIQKDVAEVGHIRHWLHQVPALRHARRGAPLDLHHAISPPRGTLSADARLIIASAQRAGIPGALVPIPTDMVLVCATHLTRETAIAASLRDVVDFDALVRHFGASPGFFEGLLRRATEIGVTPALAYAARAATTVLDTPVPGWVRVGLPRELTAPLLVRALLPDGPTRACATARLARRLLYLRALRTQLPLRKMIARSLRDKLDRLRGSGVA